MKVTLFGATGGVGRHLLEILRTSGHEVTVVVRDSSRLPQLPGHFKTVKADLREHNKIAEAASEAEGILWPVGPRDNTPDQPLIFAEALECVLTAMPAGGRIVMISGAAVPLDGDTLPLSRRFMIRLIKGLTKHTWETNVRQARVARASGRDFVLVRPGMMPEQPPSGQLRADAHRLPAGKTTKEDVARFMFEQLESDEWLGQAPLVGG